MIKRGEIYYADLRKTVGSEQGGIRPVVIIQNNVGNENSPTTIVIPVTSRKLKNYMPTHVKIEIDRLASASIVLTEQIRTIDRRRLGEFIGKLSQKEIIKIEKAIILSLGLNDLTVG